MKVGDYVIVRGPKLLALKRMNGEGMEGHVFRITRMYTRNGKLRVDLSDRYNPQSVSGHPMDVAASQVIVLKGIAYR